MQLLDMLQQSKSLFLNGRIQQSLIIVNRILASNEKNYEAIELAFKISLKMQDFIKSENYFSAMELVLDNKKILLLKIEMLEAQEEYFKALDYIEIYLLQNPDDLNFQYKYGLNSVKAGKIHQAENTFLSCKQKHFNNEFLLLNLGHIYKAKAESKESASYYHQFIKALPNQCGVGYWSLADLKDYTFNDDDKYVMEQLISSPEIAIGNFILLQFAIARVYEQRKEYNASFIAMKKANESLKKYRPFRADLFSSLITSTISTIKKQNNISLVHKGYMPIFIVGMPRSGTTLVEQILAAHSRVESTDELQYIERIALMLEKSGGYAKRLMNLGSDEKQKLAIQYIEQIQQYFTKEQAITIDKNPNNYLHIGLIKTLFPNAKIINIIRSPLDNALSVYKQYFSFGHEYSYDLKSIALYWQGYLSLMDHWKIQFGNEILQLSYEELTKNPEKEINKILSYCNLTFEEQCLNFHLSDRVVLTPSVSQVKQPMNQKSINSWEKYQGNIESFIPIFEEIKIKANKLLS